ncbi:hypothetical protein [Natronobacterium gregoryi]|uniref:Uncharacterized protein n=2 Tax=Natronobacterium gregoryi TaxID=44930 RepID=L0AG57_NATGS|nr:hypothetical protein [Natronobacterium gregoryi]AFZ72913.1 hypothetical protein Natgr_1716 [Natronobacterium gregoryi SP2]ELY69791.1 hypothetical protein C490_07316 [Natronobacterium gregoryi SP2]PLK21859.1 hypothetical protein CYV19_01820 [Natronobacterium gregoryi SP2]SFI67108.1 hypothetical protein SAMN05443661_10381 [Natronobacterium gregoryi]
MNEFVRAMVVPFFMALFPAVWFVNRNLTTAQLPPTVEPSAGLILLGLAGSVVGSAAVAALLAFVGRDRSVPSEELPYRQRIFQPDTDALLVFAALVALCAGWALVAFAGIGPAVLGHVLTFAMILPGLPLLVLAPLAIHSTIATIVGLAACALWLSVLSVGTAELTRKRSGNPTDN